MILTTVDTSLIPQAHTMTVDTKSIAPKKKVLITGTTGTLGLECLYFAERNGFLVKDISGSKSMLMDLDNPESVKKCIKNQPVFDLVIMAHGYQNPMLLPKIEDNRHEWERIISSNLSSCAYLTSSLIAHKKISYGGMIVYISSIQASQPKAGRAAYAASKAGLEGLMRSAAQELTDIKARAIALRISQFITPMKGITFTKEQIENINYKMPLGMINPKHIAELIFDLYKNPYITGEVITIDSGHSLQIWT